MTFLTAIKESQYMQYLASLTSTLSITSASLYSTWSSPILPQLTSTDSPIGITLTQDEASWVAASSALGCAVGGLLTSIILSKVGRKTALLISAVPIFLPWMVIIFAKGVITLCIARALGGFGICIATSAVPMYIGEIADINIRGKLGAMLNILRIVGSIYILSVGPFVSYTVLAITCSIFPLVFECTFWFMPESPYYLVKINQKEIACKNLKRLQADNTDIKILQVQLDEIAKTVEHDMKNKSTYKELITNPQYRRPLLIMTGLKFLQHFNGSNAIEAYMQTIIHASKSAISPELSSVIFGVIQIPAVILTAILVDKVGRRPLLITSALGCALALASEAIYFYFQNSETLSYIADSISLLPTTGLVVFLVMRSIGLSTLPYVLLGEIFPTNVKPHAVSLFTSFGAFSGFVVIKFFQPSVAAWGMHTILSIYTCTCIFGAIFVVCLVPETKGKTFMEIQASFNKTPPA